MFRTLRARLIFSHILPVLVILPVIGGIFLYLIASQVFLTSLTNELDRQAVLLSDVAGAYIEIWLDPTRSEAFVESASASVRARVSLYNSEGRLMASSDQADAGKVGKVEFTPDMGKFFQDGSKHVVMSINNGTVADVTAPVVTPTHQLVGFVQLANPLATVSERYQQLRKITVWVLIGGLLMGILMGWVLANDLQRPLSQTTQAVNELAYGHQLTPLKEQGPEEIRQLSRAFNELAERLRTLEESRKRLLANLVHELGRPLGALQSAAQALLGGADEDPQLRGELLQGMDDELHRMRHLVEDLAHLHDQILGPLELNLQVLPLGDWLARASSPWREAAQERNLSWESRIPEGLPEVKIDPDRMAQALGNLLSNAVRYTPAGGKVGLSAEETENELLIQVDDSGPGIASDEQSQIFTPFYRGKAARRFSDGMGLGLTIAKDLIEAHGGDLRMESKPGQGSRFVICLPKGKGLS